MASTSSPLPLVQLENDTPARICTVRGDAGFCQRLREMGMGEAASVTKISGTGPFLVKINGTSVMLGRVAAAQIFVERILCA